MGPEAAIEQNNVRYAKDKLGLLVLKLSLFGAGGWPDRLFFSKDGRILFIEYKAPGKNPTAHQLENHRQLRFYSHEVYVIDNPQKGRELLEAFAEGKNLPGKQTQLKLKEVPVSKKRKCPKHETGGGPCYCGRKPKR